MKMMKENRNRGLTLVELMITIAIVSIVIVTATSFMITGSRSFTKGSADSDLQKEAELTVNQIEDMIIDVNGGLEVNEVVDEEGNKTKTELVMYHATEEPDESGTPEIKYVKETVVWDQALYHDEMKYSKQDVTYDTDNREYVDGSYIAQNQLLAENVSLFEVDIDTVDETASDGTVYQIVRSVQIRVGYENSTGIVDYATSPVITLRNRMLLSGNPADIFDEPPTVPANMTLWYYDYGIKHAAPVIIDDTSEVERGYAYDIYAYLDGGTNVNHLVNWEIKETNSNSTIDSNGVLTVFPNEPNNSLTVVARYKTNPNKYAEGVLKVVGGTRSFRAITITPDSLKAFNPSFGSFPTFEGYWTMEERADLSYTWSVSEPELIEDYDSLDKTQKTFTFKVKKEPANYGKVIEVRLTAVSGVTGEPRSDKYLYHIDKNEYDGGDSFMKRGMLEHGEIQFWFDTHFIDDETGREYDVTALNWEIYFCTVDGERITEYDYLLPHVHLGGNIQENYGNHHFNYTLGYDEGLPLNREYYVKVVTHMKDPLKGTLWDHERILYIPAVQLFDYYYYSLNSGGWFDFYFGIIGYYDVALQDNPDAVEKIVGFEVETIDGDRPEGVELTANFSKPVANSTAGPNGMFVSGNISDGQHIGYLPSEIQLQHMRVKVYLKEHKEVYTYVDIYLNK